MRFLLITICIFFTNHLYATVIYIYQNSQGSTILTNRASKDPSLRLVREQNTKTNEVKSKEYQKVTTAQNPPEKTIKETHNHQTHRNADIYNILHNAIHADDH